MGGTPTSERPATDRSDDVRYPVCDDIRLDGKRKHEHFCEGKSRHGPIGTGRPFFRSLALFASNPLTFK